MKRNFIYRLILSSPILISVLSSCNNAERQSEETKDSLAEQKEVRDTNVVTEEQYQTEKTELKTMIHNELNEIDRELDDLDKKIEAEKGTLKEDHKARKQRLKERSTELRKRLDDADKTTKENWKEFKREFSHDINELGQSIKDFFKDNEK